MKIHCPLSRLSVLFMVFLVGHAATAGPEPGASERLNDSTYVDRSGDVTMVVDSYAASLRESSPYVPVRVAIGVRREGKPIRIGLDSFTLIDEKGNETSPSSLEAVQRGDSDWSADEGLFRERPILLDRRFDELRATDSRFYSPRDGSSRSMTRVRLLPETWLQDVLYFPRPASGLTGVQTLRLAAHGLDRPLMVRFYIVHPGAGTPTGGE